MVAAMVLSEVSQLMNGSGNDSIVEEDANADTG